MREEMIKCWLLAGKNDVLSPRQERERRKAMLDDFLLLHPCVKGFRGSLIEGRIHSGDLGLLFSVWLVERDQLELQLRGVRLFADCYSNELKELKDSVGGESELVASALNPLLDANHLRELVRAYPEIARLRARARSRNTRTAVINDAGLVSTQATLPRGNATQISARVHDLKPRIARLCDVVVNPAQDGLDHLEFPRFIEMSRPSFVDDSRLNERLLAALDLQTVLHLAVLIDFDSATGQPSRISFRSLREAPEA